MPKPVIITEAEPLVSIITFIKNRHDTMARCMRSVLEQDYPNIEFIIQDGASTDGTLDVIRSFNDPRIKLVSEPDKSPADAWFKSLKRCTGKYIGLIMSDETYLPGALNWAVEGFAAHPTAGAIYGDGYIMRYDGSIVGEALGPKSFSFEAYLQNDCLPHPGNTFFSRAALLDVGLFTHDWIWDACEFEVYLRLGYQYPLTYHPGYVSNFAIHDEGQLGKNVENLRRIMQGEIRIFERFFANPKLTASLRALKHEAPAGIYCRTAEMLASIGEFKEALDIIALCGTIDCQPDKPLNTIKKIRRMLRDSRRRPNLAKKRKQFQKLLLSTRADLRGNWLTRWRESSSK